MRYVAYCPLLWNFLPWLCLPIPRSISSVWFFDLALFLLFIIIIVFLVWGLASLRKWATGSVMGPWLRRNSSSPCLTGVVSSTGIGTLHIFRKYIFKWLNRFRLLFLAIPQLLVIFSYYNFLGPLLPLSSISLPSFAILSTQGRFSRCVPTPLPLLHFFHCLPGPWKMMEAQGVKAMWPSHWVMLQEELKKKKTPTGSKDNLVLCQHCCRSWDKAVASGGWVLDVRAGRRALWHNACLSRVLTVPGAVVGPGAPGILQPKVLKSDFLGRRQRPSPATLKTWDS